jgi:putative ABC transport system permease protein
LRALFQDVFYSFRSLQRERTFAFVAVFTLALGIAANTAVFSVVNAVMLRTLPYVNPQQLVVLSWYGPQGRLTLDVSAAAFFRLREEAHSFQSIAAHYASDTGVNLAASDPPQYAKAQRVSADFFHTLGVEPVIGRGFTSEEDTPGGPLAVILSYSLWRQDYNGNAKALGSEVRIDGVSYKIVGVMPRLFHSYPEADVWLPLRLTPATAEPGNEYQVIARLKDNVTIGQAQDELASSSEYRATYPLQSFAGEVRLVPEKLHDFLVSGVRKSLYSLFGAVLFVLLIGCTNLALLLTVRGASRMHEYAIRAALGSSRPRLMRVVLMDSIVIAVLGGLGGTILGKEILPFINWFAPRDLPLSSPLGIDRNVLLFAAAISVATVVLSGLTPALRMSRTSLIDVLRHSPRTTGPGHQQSALARLLVLVQVALSLFLLSGTVSLLQEFLKLQATPPGFDPEHLMVAQIRLASQRYTGSGATSALLEELTREIGSLPGVDSVATVSGLPLQQGLSLAMLPADAKEHSIHAEVQYRIASPEYFRILRIPLLAGRSFSKADDSGSPPVAMVSEGLARQWWPHESPLGHFVTVDREFGSQFSDAPREVIGVVADVRETGLQVPPPPMIYVPVRQAPDAITAFVNRWFPASILVHTSGNANIEPSISHILEAVDPNLAVISWRPLTQILAASLARPRFYVFLIGVFGSFALLLTAVGLYGLLSHLLVLRTRELALRIVMGARRFEIIAMAVRQGVGLVIAGVLLGSLFAFFLGKSLPALIYNVPTKGLNSVFVAISLLVLIAFLTSLLVAVRTTAIEPTVVLRTE